MLDFVVTEANNGSTISVSVGDTLVIQLPESPTTGFRWALAASDARILEMLTDEFELGANAAIGGGGLRIFRLVVKGQGSTRLQFRLARSWESTAPKPLFDIQVNAS